MDALDHNLNNNYNPEKISMRPLAVRYGLIMAAVGIVITLLGFLSGNDPAMPDTSMAVKIISGLLNFGATITVFALAILADRKQLGGFITLGRAVVLCILIGLVSGIVMGLFTLLYQTVINPDFIQNMKDAMIVQWEEQGLGEEQIEAASKMAFMFLTPAFFVPATVAGGVMGGALYGLILGLIYRREPYRA